MEQIEHYTDYRRFLADFYEAQKQRFPHFSYRYFCSKASLRSPSLYREVVAGKRNLTSQAALKFALGMGLTMAFSTI